MHARGNVEPVYQSAQEEEEEEGRRLWTKFKFRLIVVVVVEGFRERFADLVSIDRFFYTSKVIIDMDQKYLKDYAVRM